MRALDGVVVVLDAREGVGADFEAHLESIRDRLRTTPRAARMPIGSASSFAGVIDLIDMRASEVDADDAGRLASHCEVPIAETFGYADVLRSLAHGRAVSPRSAPSPPPRGAGSP